MKKLSGKTALVTGGSRGIGAAIAKKLASEGANIIITYSSSKPEAEAVVNECGKYGVKAMSVKANAKKPEEVDAAVVTAIKEFGAIHILVNNAGVYAGNGIITTTNEEFDDVMNVNVKSVFVAIRAVAKQMKKGGRIINIGSVLGESVGSEGLALYAMSKFAVAGLTRAVARDLGKQGINVNCIQPGPINTDMNPETGDFADAQRARIALGHYGQPEDIANLALFLASDDSSHITGTMINCDGGYNA